MNKQFFLATLFVSVLFYDGYCQLQNVDQQTPGKEYFLKLENKIDSIIATQKEESARTQEKLVSKIEETERKLEISKSNLDFKNDGINKWLGVLGIVIAIFGIGIPFLGFFYGRRLSDNLEREQKKVSDDLKEFKNEAKGELKDFIKDAKEKILRLENEASVCIVNLKSKEVVGLEIISNLERVSSQATKHHLSESEKKDLVQQADDIKNNKQANPYEKDMADALSVYLSNNYKDAIPKLEKLPIEYPKEITVNKLAEIYFYLGFCYQKTNQIDKSIDFFEKALWLDHGLASAWCNLGNSYYKQSEYEKAFDCYQKAIQIKPDYHIAWNNLANVYAIQKKHEEAIRCFKRTIELKPLYANGYANFIEYLFICGYLNDAKTYLFKVKQIVPLGNFAIRFFEILISISEKKWEKNIDSTYEDLILYGSNDASLKIWDFTDILEALNDPKIDFTEQQCEFIKVLIFKIQGWVKENLN